MSPTPDQIAEREQVAHERHQWVRLTRCCNNRCAFCLDSASHDGGCEPTESIRDHIRAGRNEGATRLILSGGEPTLHPEYVDLIRFGTELGYSRIQTITNGRRFAYAKYLGACLDAGLGEITFSIHGHTPELHDELVGVPGAFEQAVAGLRAALADGRPIVNVDVCLNRRNIAHLPELLDRFIGFGVREFDLLHLIPFGRAQEERQDLFYDVDDALPSIEYALGLAERPDLHIWFNRFPPEYLEGHEELIQDPNKLFDEVRGRHEELTRRITEGTPLACRQPDRCPRCYLRGLCDVLDETCERLARDGFEILRVDLRTSAASRRAPRGSFRASWVRAARLEDVVGVVADLPGDGLILELDVYGSIGDLAELAGGKRLVRAYAARPEDVDRLLGMASEFEVVAVLSRVMTEHLEANHPRPDRRLALAYKSRELSTEAEGVDGDLPAFFARYAREEADHLPACITGRCPRELPRVLDAELLNASGQVDLDAFTRRFILDRYLLKGRRCRTCTHDASCAGAHINLIRAHGFGWLQPIG